MGTAGKSIADFFAGAYIVGKLENHHTGRISVLALKYLNL